MGMYETIFILDSLLVPEEIDKIIDSVKQVIESNGGKIATVDKWGKRRLAYEIQKKQYGFYVAIEFEGEGPIPNTLEHEYNFNDKILRYLTYRYTKNKMKARDKEIEMKKSEPKDLETEKPVPAPEAPTAPEPEVTIEEPRVVRIKSVDARQGLVVLTDLDGSELPDLWFKTNCGDIGSGVGNDRSNIFRVYRKETGHSHTTVSSTASTKVGDDGHKKTLSPNHVHDTRPERLPAPCRFQLGERL